MDQSFSSDSESEPLLSPVVQIKTTIKNKLHQYRFSFLPRQLCLPSKAAVLILLWTVVVSAIYATVSASTGVGAQIVSEKIHFGKVIDKANLNEKTFFAYMIFAIAALFYPFAGFIADVYAGRCRVVIISLFLLLFAFLFLSIDSVLFFAHAVNFDVIGNNNDHNSSAIAVIAFIIFGIIGYFLAVIGLAGYQANYIQFGLDQLLDAPNEYQGLFVHWVQWFTVLAYSIFETLFAWYSCRHGSNSKDVVMSVPMVFVVALTLLLFITYCQRKSFYTRCVRDNPYKVVIRVLNFARKHKYPLRRSAFTYCDDEEPSRIDFAKERYGGPFTTEQVEDVKTFIRILIVLIVIGPVFVINIPSEAVFTLFAQHFTLNRESDSSNCTLIWATLDSGVVKYYSAVVFFIAYIWLVYSLLRNCIPKIFVRLWTAHFLFVIGALGMLIIETVGHIIYYEHNKHNGKACMFLHKLQFDPEMELGLHWAVLILPNILMGITPVLVMTNAFEFISAQSPHSMSGLFIGLFLAIRGFFQFLGSIVLYPFFSMDHFWRNNHLILSCGFGYLLFTCVVGVLSLVFLTVIAKKYKYRERNNQPYNRIHVERLFAE